MSGIEEWSAVPVLEGIWFRMTSHSKAHSGQLECLGVWSGEVVFEMGQTDDIPAGLLG